MLHLPEELSRQTAGHIARAMLGQAEALHEYSTAARLLARACVELYRDTRSRRAGWKEPTIAFEERVIRINDHAWLIADYAEHQLEKRAQALRRVAHAVHILVPPQSAVSIQGNPALQRYATTIRGIDSYVDLRVLFTSGDTGATYTEILVDLLHRYAKLCDASAVPQLIPRIKT